MLGGKSNACSLGYSHAGRMSWHIVHLNQLTPPCRHVTHQIRLTDVRAIEDCLDTLQHGNIEGERGLSMRNCMQLFRLLQLAIEYITHLRNAHALLLTCYSEASATASRCGEACK